MFMFLTFLILFDFCFENFDGLVNVLLYRDLSLHSHQYDLKSKLRIKFTLPNNNFNKDAHLVLPPQFHLCEENAE
jgi:hypothetical protein